MQYGVDHFFYRSFRDEGIAFDESRLQPIPVLNGQTYILGETAYADTVILGWGAAEYGGLDSLAGGAGEKFVEGILMREDEEVKVEYRIEKLLQAPVEAGMEVGEITYSVGDTVYLRESIVTTEAVQKIDFAWCVSQILSRYCIF